MTPCSPTAEAPDLKSGKCSFESSHGDSVGRCVTCKHWGDPDPDNSWDYVCPPGYKVCMHAKIDDGGHYIDDDKPCTGDNICDDALVSAWREMGAPLTGPRFGCVHWEAREISMTYEKGGSRGAWVADDSLHKNR